MFGVALAGSENAVGHVIDVATGKLFADQSDGAQHAAATVSR